MSLDPERAERAARAYELKRQGRTYQFIAEAMGCAQSTAYELVQYAIKARMPAAAEQERLFEVDRLDRMLSTLEDRLVAGVEPEKIVPVMLRVSERRARLMGLDAPTRARVSFDPPAEVPEVGFARIVDEAQGLRAPEDDADGGGEVRDAG